MPSRMEKYYNQNEIKTRTNKNEKLYKSIYDEVEYSNVEGISVIEKNEKIDIDKIYELIKGSKKEEKEKKEYPKREEFRPIEPIEEKNYDIVDILNKAKEEREEEIESNTQYNVLKNLELNKNYKAPTLDDDELKRMIETITNNSKNDSGGDLLDDLKTIHDDTLATSIKEDLSPTVNMDKSFYSSSLSFTDDDFEQIKDSIKKNNKLTKVLIFMLSVIVVTGIIFLIFFLAN